MQVGPFSIAGRYNYAEHFSFVSVHVGNTSPNMYAAPDGLVAAVSGKEFAPIGRICTDYRAATIIDEQTLVDIIAQKMEREAAQAIVQEYLAQNDVQRFVTAPGTYHLYFHANQTRFAENTAALDVDLAGFEDPFFILANRPIALNAAADAAVPIQP